MQINEEILEIFKEMGIRKDDGICYLISLYHGYNPTYIPEELKMKMNLTKIVVSVSSGLKWNIPLYLGVETAFEWVKSEYVIMFKEKNSMRGGKVREATARMKKLFADNPDIRKDDVIGATRMYLLNTDGDFIMNPHYFIIKGVGAEKTYTILDWIEKYQLTQDTGGRTTSNNVIQF